MTITSQVINGNNQTLQCICTIPSDSVGLIEGWWGSLSGKATANVTFTMRAGEMNGVGYVQQRRSIIGADFDYDFKKPILIGPGLEIWIEVLSASPTDTSVAGGFTITYKKDSLKDYPNAIL